MLAIAAVAAVAVPAGAQSLSVDASGGTAFSPAIFGQNFYAKAYYTAGIGTGFEKNLQLTDGTSMRGPSSGTNAMTYDWETRIDAAQNVPLPGGGGFANSASTLDMLRMARDHHSLPIFTVNEQGIGTLNSSAVFSYTDKSIGTMTQLASDWVRYTNFIVQNYRQGQESLMSADDRRILNELSWGGPDFTSDLLLKPGEAPVPKVTYWEIGNESEYYDDATTYRSRYASITAAMLAQDPTIKVGAGMAGMQAPANGTSPDYLKTLLKNGFDVSSLKNYAKLPVDFIAYHPYGYQILSVDAGNPANHGAISQQLNNIRTNQQAERDWVNSQITASNALGGNRSPSNFQFLATEWNSAVPDPGPGQDGNWRFRQWNALGVVETAMTFAQMGFSAAQFWVWPADIYGGDPSGAELPQYKAFQALDKYGGDTLVESYTSEDNFRLYITKDSKTGTVAIWGMNFLFGDPGDAAKTIHLSLSNLGIDPGKITLMRLADLTGPTTLLSGNDYLTNGVTVDWITSDLTGQIDLSNFDFTVNPAELSLMVIQVPEPSSALGGIIGFVLVLTSRPFERRKACASRPSLLPINGGLL